MSHELKRDYERIWLTEELGEVNWCQDRISKDDTEYVRADLVAQYRGLAEAWNYINDSTIPDDLQTAVSRGLRLAGFSFTVDTMLTVAREIQGLLGAQLPDVKVIV